MEGYLEIFGRKFCGKKGNFGLGYGEGNYFLGSGNTGFDVRFTGRAKNINIL